MRRGGGYWGGERERSKAAVFCRGFSGWSPQEASRTLELLRGDPDTDRGWQLCAPGSMRSLRQKLFLFQAFLTLCIIEGSRPFAGSLRVPPAHKDPSVPWLGPCPWRDLPSFPTHRETQKAQRDLGTGESWPWGQCRFAPEFYCCPMGLQIANSQ